MTPCVTLKLARHWQIMQRFCFHFKDMGIPPFQLNKDISFVIVIVLHSNIFYIHIKAYIQRMLSTRVARHSRNHSGKLTTQHILNIGNALYQKVR